MTRNLPKAVYVHGTVTNFAISKPLNWLLRKIIKFFLHQKQSDGPKTQTE